MHKYIPRALEEDLVKYLKIFPAVVLLGPRQCGKSTLAKKIKESKVKSVYLDLEKPSDLNKLNDPELFFEGHKNDVIFLDEIQKEPQLFSSLRSVIDEDRKNGRFLLLGSASRDLVQKSSQTLAGRVGYLELTPFTVEELRPKSMADFKKLWIRGGFPESILAVSEEYSREWRENFIRSYIERDLPQLGFSIPASTWRRFLSLCSHLHGQIVNLSKIGDSFGIKHPTVKHYLDILEWTFIIRQLRPFETNTKKRLIKSPKLYLRDSGLLHQLLEIQDFDHLLGHPAFGASWEGFVIENIITHCHGWKYSFYRDSHGNELDLILEKGRRTIAIECKASKAPVPGKSFWNSLDVLGIKEAWLIAPIQDHYEIKKGVKVAGLQAFLDAVE